MTPEEWAEARGLAISLGELRSRFGDETVARELARQVGDPGIVVTALTGEPIWGVRYEVCRSYADRRDVVRSLGRVGHVAGTVVTWEKRWPCRLVLYVQGTPLDVDAVFAALDARTKPQVTTRVPPRSRRGRTVPPGR